MEIKWPQNGDWMEDMSTGCALIHGFTFLGFISLKSITIRSRWSSSDRSSKED